MRHITVNTVQGIGDIFWVYQKLAPHVDSIHWRVWRVGDESLQWRSRPLLAMLPKTASFEFPQVSSAQYHALAESKHPLSEVLKHSTVNYAVNAMLEAGVDLEGIDPGYKVEWDVPLLGAIPPRAGNALCLFVAGTSRSDVWSTEAWADHSVEICRRLGLARVDVIGAEWDLPNARQVTIDMQRRGLHVTNHCNTLTLAESISVIRSSAFFFGYQSGLNVLAENYHVPQLMVYFPFLSNMMYTWVRPSARRTRFHATTFDALDPLSGVNER